MNQISNLTDNKLNHQRDPKPFQNKPGTSRQINIKANIKHDILQRDPLLNFLQKIPRKTNLSAEIAISRVDIMKSVTCADYLPLTQSITNILHIRKLFIQHPMSLSKFHKIIFFHLSEYQPQHTQ